MIKEHIVNYETWKCIRKFQEKFLEFTNGYIIHQYNDVFNTVSENQVNYDRNREFMNSQIRSDIEDINIIMFLLLVFILWIQPKNPET